MIMEEDEKGMLGWSLRLMIPTALPKGFSNVVERKVEHLVLYTCASTPYERSRVVLADSGIMTISP